MPKVTARIFADYQYNQQNRRDPGEVCKLWVKDCSRRSARGDSGTDSGKRAERKISQQKVDDGRRNRLSEEDQKGIGQVPVDGNEEILRVAIGLNALPVVTAKARVRRRSLGEILSVLAR